MICRFDEFEDAVLSIELAAEKFSGAHRWLRLELGLKAKGKP